MADPEDTYGAGLDFGTSGARLSVVSARSLGVVHEGAVAYAEQSPRVWSEALGQLLREIPAAVKPHIKRVCISGTSSSVLLADGGTGAITRGPRMYDFSASRESVELASSRAPQGHTVRSSTSTLAKVLMWHQEDPIKAHERICHQADFLVSELVGVEHGYYTDWNNVLKLGYDVRNLAYPAWLLELLAGQGLSAGLLPKVVSPGGEIRQVSERARGAFGLPGGCVVVGGTTDSVAAFVAARACLPGQAVTSLGSTVAIKLLSTVQVDDAAYGVYSHRLGDSWLIGGASNVGCAILRQEGFSDEELAELSEAIDPAAEPPERARGYYPLVRAGERFPVNDPAKEPRLDPKPDSRAEYLHGLLHGIAAVERDGFARLRELGADAVTRVYTAGGGSRNGTWGRMREGMLGVPVSAAEHTEAAYGCALLALGRLGGASASRV